MISTHRRTNARCCGPIRCLGIDWPLEQVGGASVVLVSDKDKVGKPLAEAEVYE